MLAVGCIAERRNAGYVVSVRAERYVRDLDEASIGDPLYQVLPSIQFT